MENKGKIKNGYKKVRNQIKEGLSMIKYKHGVLLGRFQPIHNGHLKVINQMAEECENVLILVNGKEGTLRNPFPNNEVLSWIYWVTNQENLDIQVLSDLRHEGNKKSLYQWGDYLYLNIVCRLGTTDFVFYYNDDISEWFRPEIREHIKVVQIPKDDISATKVRKAILERDVQAFIRMVPESLHQEFIKMYKLLTKVVKNPKPDTSLIEDNPWLESIFKES